MDPFCRMHPGALKMPTGGTSTPAEAARPEDSDQFAEVRLFLALNPINSAEELMVMARKHLGIEVPENEATMMMWQKERQRRASATK